MGGDGTATPRQKRASSAALSGQAAGARLGRQGRLLAVQLCYLGLPSPRKGTWPARADKGFGDSFFAQEALNPQWIRETLIGSATHPSCSSKIPDRHLIEARTDRGLTPLLTHSIAQPLMTPLDTTAALSIQNQAGLVVRKDGKWPPTSWFPAEVQLLERSMLENNYLELRRNYKGLMISRGIHQQRSKRQAKQLHEFKQRLRSMAADEAIAKGEAYAMLEIIADVVNHLEADDEALNASFQEYQGGRRQFNGAAKIGGLIQAVIRFVNNWQNHKQRFKELAARQQLALRTLPSANGQAA